MEAPLPAFVDTELPCGHPFAIQPESEVDDIEELTPAHDLQGSVEIFDLTEEHPFELRKTAETYDPFEAFQIIETDDPEPEPEMTEIPEIPLSGRRNRLSVPIPENSRLYETGFSEEVRRCSVSSNSVLQFLGAVLGNGNEEKKHASMAKAFDEEQWDYFISHNWSVKRWKKFLALCLVWSGQKAFICCCLSQLLCFVLISIGILPTTTSHTDGHEISIWCIGACLVAYLVVFMLVPDFLSCLGFAGYRTFLDKVCVDQSNEERKKEGIQAITAFLYHSDTLLVLFSDVYLRRLWTVFELTTFLALKPDANIVVQPVLLGPVVLYFVILRSLRIAEVFLIPSTLENGPSLESPTFGAIVILITVDLLGTLLGAIFLRMWGRTRSNMTQQISEFAFESAECHDEADRMEILGSIKALARQEGLVDADAPTLECIKSFEKIVQERVPRRIEGSFLMTGIPCKVAFLISLPSMAVALDHSAVRLRLLLQETIDENSVWEAAAEILKAANQECWMPIAIGLVGILSGTRKRGPCCETGIIFLCFFLLVMGLWLPAAPLIPRTADLIHAADIRCLLFGATFAMQCTMLWCLYSSSSVLLRCNRRYEGKCSGPEIIKIS